MFFEIFIPPDFDDLNIIQNNINWFFKYKNYLNKHSILIYTKYEESQLNIKKSQKLNIQYIKIPENITTIKKLWEKYSNNYNQHDWIIHYNVKYRLIEFDFIKMIFKKLKNTFVKKNQDIVYYNLFCINYDLLTKYISSNVQDISPLFIINNSDNYYFLKYMNIISKKNGTNIYI